MPNMSDTEQWAIVSLMGHAETAGRISMEAGLLRVDVPEKDSYRTELYGIAAIYSIKLVSEQIARAYVAPVLDHYTYDAPIVTREEHLHAMRKLEEQNSNLQSRIHELERRLTAIKALPDGL